MIHPEWAVSHDAIFCWLQSCPNNFLGVKNGWKHFGLNMRHIILDPLIVWIPKNTVFACSDIWGPGPPPALCRFGSMGPTFGEQETVNGAEGRGTPGSPPPPSYGGSDMINAQYRGAFAECRV